jgi:DNA-binding transcriptional LysR family regulator
VSCSKWNTSGPVFHPWVGYISAMTHATTERLDLNRVAIFLQVAEAQGVNAAAAKAKLPKSSVSRALTQLEAELGVELVVRRTKSFQLTEAGQDFYDAASRGIAAVSDARERLRRETSVPRGKLRVAAPPGFASFMMMPVIADFVSRYSEVEIELCVTAAPVEPSRDGFDVVLTSGALEDSSARVRRMGSSEQGIYASREYLAAHGTPKKPSDLARHTCILSSRQRRKTVWSLTGPGGSVDIQARGRITVDDVFAGIAAADAGAGLFVLPVHMVNVDPTTRALVRVLPEWTLRGESIQIVYPGGRYLPRRITAFVDALDERLRSSCPKPT